jgi:hypothetical protein
MNCAGGVRGRVAWRVCWGGFCCNLNDIFRLLKTQGNWDPGVGSGICSVSFTLGLKALR